MPKWGLGQHGIWTKVLFQSINVSGQDSRDSRATVELAKKRLHIIVDSDSRVTTRLYRQGNFSAITGLSEMIPYSWVVQIVGGISAATYHACPTFPLWCACPS